MSRPSRCDFLDTGMAAFGNGAKLISLPLTTGEVGVGAGCRDGIRFPPGGR